MANSANNVESMLMISPDYDPTKLTEFRRNKMLGQMMMEQGKDMPKGQMIGDRYVAPSWTQQLASVLNRVVGADVATKADEGEQAYNAQTMRSIFGGGTPTQSATPAQPDAVPTALGTGSSALPNTPDPDGSFQNAGGTGPTTANAALLQQLKAQNPVQQPAQPAPDNWQGTGMSNKQAMLSMMLGGNVGDAIIKASSPTDLQRNAAAGYGAGTPAAAAAIRQSVNPPITLRGPLMQTNAQGQLEANPASIQALRQAEDLKGQYSTIKIPTSNGQEITLSPTEFSNYQNTGMLPGRLLPQQLQPEPGSPYAEVAGGTTFQGQQLPAGRFAPVPGVGQIGVSQSPVDQRRAESIVTGDQDYLNKAWQEQMSRHQSAQTVKSQLQNIAALAEKTYTGTESDRLNYINGLLGLVGVKGAADMNSAYSLLQKSANQVITKLGGSGQMGSSDIGRTMIEAANPNGHMSREAIKEAVSNLSAAQDIEQARTRLLQGHFEKRDRASFDRAATTFDKIADPNLFLNAQRFKNTPTEQRGAVKAQILKTDPNFFERLKALESLGVQF